VHAHSIAVSAMAQSPVNVSVTIRADQPGPVINPNIYGQFAEHLGAGIYEGVWVGEKSPIPNTNGYRNDVIAALKNLKVPVVRWPGGCFADEYHWRDGIGDRSKRPVKVNTHWGGVAETNEFGTHEFMAFAEMIGTKVYISGNVGSGSPQEMADWMEYMTSNTVSTLANERRKNGRDQPWEVHFFGIGNETWGCGGNMTAGVLRESVPPVRHVRQGAARPPAEDRREWRQRRAHVVGRRAHEERASRHGCHLASLLHHADRCLAEERQRGGFPRIRMDLDAQGTPCRSTSTSPTTRRSSRSAIRRTAWRSTSMSGAPGTTRSRAANRAFSTSRTRCATHWSRGSTSTSFTVMPSACR
jgi:hypothetical protein